MMEQPRYRFEEFRLQSDKNYTDMNDTIIGFLVDNETLLPDDIRNRLQDIINDMLVNNFDATQKLLAPSDFEVSISIEMNTNTNKVLVSIYIFNEDGLNLHTEIDTETLHDYGRMKKFFFNTLSYIVLNRIEQLQKAVGIKGLFAS